MIAPEDTITSLRADTEAMCQALALYTRTKSVNRAFMTDAEVAFVLAMGRRIYKSPPVTFTPSERTEIARLFRSTEEA